MAKQNLGMVTAYAYAVAGGYTGTEAEFEALLGNIATDLEEIENLTVTATTLPEGSSATASYSDGVLTLGIPKGDTGATGAGATATAGTTTTGEPGTNANVVNSGTTKDAVFDFTIPRGDTGNGIESITLTSTVGAVHTYTITFTDGDTTTFEVTDGEVTTAALTAILADYAKTDGAYESMTVGNAEQLISSVYVTDEEPYQFRTSGGSADIGDRETDMLIGGSVAWNQLVQNGNFADGTTGWNIANGTVSVANGKATLTATGGALAFYRATTPKATGHKVLCLFKGVASKNILLNAYWGDFLETVSLSTTEAQIAFVSVVGSGNTNFNLTGYLDANDTVTLSNIQLFDLTQMFGSTIADYIYSLEQANAGVGVAFFRKYFPKPYYPHDAGTIKSVEGVSAHKTVGFNAWDEEWRAGYYDSSTGEFHSYSTQLANANPIKVLPNITYHITPVRTMGGARIVYRDSSQNLISIEMLSSFGAGNFTTPSNCKYVDFCTMSAYGGTYHNDICINLSWDGERDGEYEPYVEHSYPLDDSLTLRGIPKLANGKLYYDGDTYESDGTVTRKYGIVDLGSLTWTAGNANGYTSASLSTYAKGSGNNNTAVNNYVCQKYVCNTAWNALSVDYPMTLRISGDGKNIAVVDTNFANTSATSVKSALNGVYAVYELATPTTETADTFVNPQIVDDFGTEEYITTSIVPVGHETKYTNNLKAKLEMSPESPSGDGLYLVQQSSGQNAYVQYISPVPSNPSTDGTYVLKATVSGGTATLTWVAE